jgi:hypothetical protein
MTFELINSFERLDELSDNSYIVCDEASETHVIDRVMGLSSNLPFNYANTTVKASMSSFNSNYSKCALAYPSTPYVKVFDSSDIASNSQSIPSLVGGDCNWVNFTNDDSELMTCQANGAGKGLQFWDATTLLNNPNVDISPSGTVYQVIASNNGVWIALISSAGDRIYIYDYATKLRSVGILTLPASTALRSIHFSEDSSLFGVAIADNTHTFAIYDTTQTPWVHINPTAADVSVLTTLALDLKFSPDGSKFAVVGTRYIEIWDSVTIGRTQLIDYNFLPSKTSSTVISNCIWESNNLLLCVDNTNNSLIRWDLTAETGTVVSFGLDAEHINIWKRNLYEISCTITESLTETEWMAVAIHSETGLTVGSEIFTGSSFTLKVSTPHAVAVMVMPNGISIWGQSKDYVIGDKVYPTTPTTVPFYFKCTNSGTSGVSEPIWNTTIPSSNADGTAIWAVQEAIIKPDTNLPIIPTPV